MNRIQPDTQLPKTPAIQTYIANMTQLGAGSPTETLLYNNGNLTIEWTRDTTGVYIGTLTTYPSIDLQMCATAKIEQSNTDTRTYITTYLNTINIRTYDGAYIDGALDHAAFELNIFTDLITPTI